MHTLLRPALRLLLAASALALVATAAQAQWKWRDKTGQVNVSDRPPPMDVPEKDILSRPTPEAQGRVAVAPPAASAASGAAPAKGPLERELDNRKRQAEQEQAAKAKAEEEKVAAQRAENCRRARGHLSALESGQRIARTNEKGEREILDDRGRADEMRQAREVITSDCK
jgi:Domain of unknown function (DUF4124)